MVWQALRYGWRWQKIREELQQRGLRVIGITGSSGVPLTQEALLLALSEPNDTWVSLPSPLRPTYAAAPELAPLLQASSRGAIIPLAVENPGEVDWIVQQIPFYSALVTRIGSKNLDKFGNKNMVAHEHTSLVSALPKSGHAILNADDELVSNMAYHTAAQVVLYGTSTAATVRLVRSV
ncbi:MAG: Mur ligase family protein, partial [Patescibacteria group bacterium]